MKDSDHCLLTIRELSVCIKNKEISPIKLVELFLERMNRFDGTLNAFITKTPDEALKSAKRLEEEIKSGSYRGPLHGIPMSFKDNIFTRGIRTTSGSKIFSSHVPDFDADVVQRLRDAGVVLLGKNNMAEFAYGITNENPFYGTTRNPWDISRTSGGSSGGSAVSVSASLASASIGTDTGGSIRIPCSLCGVVGFKPTYGLASLQGIIPLSWSLDHVGPIAKCVWDAAVISEVISGNRITITGETNITIGVLRYHFFDLLQLEVRNRIEAIIQLLKEIGYKTDDVHFPEARNLRNLTLLIMSAEAAAYHKENFEKRPHDFGDAVRKRLESGYKVSAVDYLIALEARKRLLEDFLRLTKGCDVFLTPTVPITAPKLGIDLIEYGEGSGTAFELLPKFTSAFNLFGLPAITIPCGTSSNGLPIGVQIIGKPFRESDVLSVAKKLEENLEHCNIHPESFS